MTQNDPYAFMKDHIQRYLATNGEDGHLMNGVPCLVLTTTGKKSGEKRQVAVIYGQHGKNYVVIASKAGSDTPPAWFVNLEANRRAHIQVKDKKMDVTMRIAEGAERQQLWDLMAKIYPEYNDYQKNTTRRIAVCVLEPSQSD